MKKLSYNLFEDRLVMMNLPNTYAMSRVFKRSTAGLNLEFYLSNIGCHAKSKNSLLPCYLPIAR